MSEPLSAETVARMKAEHTPDDSDLNDAFCSKPDCLARWPCDAALLLAELERREQVQSPVWMNKSWTTADIVYDLGHCHCGRDGMEPAHPRHDDTIGWSSRNQGWQESSGG